MSIKTIEWRAIQKQSNDIIDEMYQNEEMKKAVFNINPAAGKSWIELYTAYKYGTAILFEPTKRLVNQFMDTDFPYKDEMNFIQINSDAKVLKNPKKNKKNVIIANIQSSEKVKEYIQKNNIKVSFVIYDEAHKYTSSKKIKNTIEDDDDEVSFDEVKEDIVSFKDYKQLFFSGSITKTIFDNEDIFGKEVVKYTYYDCLMSGEDIVCPFEVIVSHINEVKKPMTEEKIYEMLIGDMCKYIKRYNKQKTLIFTSYANDCKTKNFRTSIKKFKKYADKFDKDIKLFYLESKMNTKKTNEELKEFKECKTPAVLISCKKISEGIDIKKCDMVALLDPTKSVPTNLQRATRSTRYDPENPNKLAHIYIPIFLEEEGDVNDEIKGNQYELAVVICELIKTNLDMKPLFNIISKNNKQSGLFERTQKTRDEFNAEGEEEQTSEPELEQTTETEEEEQTTETEEEEQTTENEEEEQTTETEEEEQTTETEEEQKTESELEQTTDPELEQTSEEQTTDSKVCKINVYINVDIDDVYDIKYYVDNFQKLTAEIVEIDWKKCLEAFVEENPGKIPTNKLDNKNKYNRKTEKAIAQWIYRSENNEEDRKYILNLLPNAYENKRLTIEEKKEALRKYQEETPNDKPSNKGNKKYHKMKESELYEWIQQSKNKPDIRNIIESIKPNAYETKESFTLEEKKEALKKLLEIKDRPSASKKKRTDTCKYADKMTESQLYNWIQHCKYNNLEERKVIESLLPDAYKKRKRNFTLEEKKESLKIFYNNINPKRKPNKRCKNKKKYGEMTEKQIGLWINSGRTKKNKKHIEIIKDFFPNYPEL